MREIARLMDRKDGAIRALQFRAVEALHEDLGPLMDLADLVGGPGMTKKRSAEQSFAELRRAIVQAGRRGDLERAHLVTAQAATARPMARHGARLPALRAILGAGALAGAASARVRRRRGP